MSYWGAQVIVNLFAAIPFIGPELSIWIRGDYVVSDATLNRFFAFHVIAIPLVLVGLVAAHRWCCTKSVRTTRTASRSRKARRTSTTSQGRHSVPSVLHGARPGRRRGLPAGVRLHRVLRAGNGRVLPEFATNFIPADLAQDATAHRPGLVLHAVLPDAARHHRRVRHVWVLAGASVLGAIALLVKSNLKGFMRIAVPGIPIPSWPCCCA